MRSERSNRVDNKVDVSNSYSFEVKHENYTDYLAICQTAVFGRVRQTLAWISAIFSAGALGVYISFLGDNPTAKTILALALVSILGWLCGYIGSVLVCYIPRPEYVAEGGSFLGKASLDCKLNAVHWEHESGVRSSFPWSAIKAVKRRNKTVVLMLDNAMGIVVPTSAFHNDQGKIEIEARERFISYVEEKIS